MADDLNASFKRAFPGRAVPKSAVAKCELLMGHLLPSVSDDRLERFCEYFRQQVRQHYTKLNTVQNAFVRLRKLAKNVRPSSVSVSQRVFQISEQEKQRARATSERRVEENNNSVISFSQRQIERWVKQLKKSDDPIDHITLLMFQSGLRLIEVLRVAEVAPAESKTAVTVTRVAKQRGRTFKPLEKPLLFTTYDAFVRTLEKTREYVRGKTNGRNGKRTNQEITNTFNHTVNERIRSLTGGTYSSHIARKIYGALSYKLFADPAKVSLNAWLEKVLGHKNITTSLSYSNVHVD